VAQLAQHHHDPLRDLAHLALQKPPGGHPFSFRASSWHVAYLSPLWQARPNVPLRTSAPSQRSRQVGALLVCAHCSYNADRDYCAAVNIARLGVAFLMQMQATGKAKACSVTDENSVKPCPYMAHGAVLLFPPQVQTTRLLEAGKIYINGWKKSCTVRSSYATPLMLRLCGLARFADGSG
jgi:hypothetical protein